MELALVANHAIPQDAVLSIRAGSVRRQAGISSGRVFRFPNLGTCENPLMLQILQPIGTTYLVTKPGEDRYRVSFADGQAAGMTCDLEVRRATSQPVVPPSAGKSAEEKRGGTTSGAKEAADYLERHQLLDFLQALLQCLIRERPKDPYAYMASQCLGGSVSAETAARQPPSKPRCGPVVSRVPVATPVLVPAVSAKEPVTKPAEDVSSIVQRGEEASAEASLPAAAAAAEAPPKEGPAIAVPEDSGHENLEAPSLVLLDRSATTRAPCSTKIVGAAFVRGDTEEPSRLRGAFTCIARSPGFPDTAPAGEMQSAVDEQFAHRPRVEVAEHSCDSRVSSSHIEIALRSAGVYSADAQ